MLFRGFGLDFNVKTGGNTPLSYSRSKFMDRNHSPKGHLSQLRLLTHTENNEYRKMDRRSRTQENSQDGQYTEAKRRKFSLSRYTDIEDCYCFAY